MNFKMGDRVRITNKNDIEGEIVGFYTHSKGAVVKTDLGHEWIINPVNLKLLKGEPKEKK